ncbi:HEAT repeat domain-containing protein [Natrinema marinum]|uniref:HEAT repeat domain-containing protein n=1 Tax=Natrinema marinum TaxID=2961598 RepID=UPI0020C8B011|nr:HEAT repeat domain-containing protein [Natrinema marinum]
MEAETGTVEVDLVQVSGEVAPEGGKGRFEEEVELESELSIDPIPVSITEQLAAVAEAGQETIAFYREHGIDPSTVRGSLPTLVEDVELALESIKECSSLVFDSSLDVYEELLLENSTSADDTFGPIRDDWLLHRARETDAIEQLIDERIRPADADTARRWYKSLLLSFEDEIIERTLDALATEPDQGAIGGLLLFVWDDGPRFGPRAISILGTLLATSETFEETREERRFVLEQLEEIATHSEHAHVRAAAVEALGQIGESRSRTIFETARDDPDPEVRAAAEAALERLEGDR